MESIVRKLEAYEPPQEFVPFQIEYQLATPMIMGYPWIFGDGLLARQLMIELLGDEFYNLPAKSPLPIWKYLKLPVKQSGDIYHASASILDTDEKHTLTLYKRFHEAPDIRQPKGHAILVGVTNAGKLVYGADIESARQCNALSDTRIWQSDKLWKLRATPSENGYIISDGSETMYPPEDFGPRPSGSRIRMNSGQLRNFMLKFPYSASQTVKFNFMGNEREVARLMGSIWHIGKKHAAGGGEIASMKVTRLPTDESIIKDGVAMRSIPTKMLKSFGDIHCMLMAYRFPHWDSNNVTLCVAPGGRCEI